MAWRDRMRSDEGAGHLTSQRAVTANYSTPLPGEDTAKMRAAGGGWKCRACAAAWNWRSTLGIAFLLAAVIAGYVGAKRSPRLRETVLNNFKGKFADTAKVRVVFITYQLVSTVRWSMDESESYPPPYSQVEQLVSSVTLLSVSKVCE